MVPTVRPRLELLVPRQRSAGVELSRPGPQHMASAPLVTNASPGELSHRGLHPFPLGLSLVVVLRHSVTVSCPLTAAPTRLLDIPIPPE